MPKIANFFVKIATILVIVLFFNLGTIPFGWAMTQKLEFQTTDGHIIKTNFSYDATKSQEIISEQGKGKTKVVDNLQINFYQPSGKLIASYNNIVNGIARGTYFEFNFDPASKQLLGNIDLGGEFPGEMYLKGDSNGDLRLIQVDESGQEQAIAKVTAYFLSKG